MRRSPHDREILLLAVPALGALAAEPLYLLVNTAIVGHLGTRQLAALALAASVLGAVVGLCNFLAYGTTARVARLHGSGDVRGAGEVAAQALWLATGVGCVLAIVCVIAAAPLMSLVGGEGRAADLAARYLRLSAAGVPCALIAIAAQGWLRGVSDLRTPLVIVVAANGLNVVLEVLFVLVFGWGLDGSAIGTVIAQLGMAAAFVVVLVRASRAAGSPGRPNPAILRDLSRIGSHIVVRTGSILLAFIFAGAVLARVGDASLAAHQIAFQLFIFLALILDAIAIAGQILVGRMLGAGDGEMAREAALRMCAWGLACGCLAGLALLAAKGVLPNLFTGDEAVRERARALWPLFALMAPIGGIVFALDGILLGSGDTGYLAVTMVIAAAGVFVPLTLLAGLMDWGVVGVWVAIDAFMVARLIGVWARFRGDRWLVLGAPG